jgi:PAS domain S-box-containing protein
VRRQAELALEATNQTLRTLYEKTPAMMHSIDRDGRLVTVSDLWLRALGYERSQVLGRRSEEFLDATSQQRALGALAQLWRSGRVDRLSLRMLRADGKTIDVLLSAIRQDDAAGTPERALAVIEDVTEVLARTAELQREQALRQEVERHAEELDRLLAERGEMLNVLAHEVRQPLNNASAALQSAAHLLADRGEAAASERLERAQSVLGNVLAGVDNTLAVASLLAAAAPLAPADTDTDIDTMVAVTVGDLPPEERSRIVVERASAARTAAMDFGLMRLALRNLLANALRHSPPGATVRVRIDDADDPPALLIDVIDSGEGIAEDLLPRLFSRGAVGRGRSGHGLGLFIVRRALELQRGAAMVLATGTSGTTMRLVLPQGGDD